MEVTGVQWHPSNKDIVLTSSLDGSLRIWDLTGALTFGNLINKHVLKIRAATGQNRLGATCCCYSPDGTKMIGGAADGSLHIWIERKTYTRADAVIRPAHAPDRVVTCVVVSPNGQLLATRGEDSTVKLWDLQSLLSSSSFSASSSSSSSSHRAPVPLKTYGDLPNSYPTANVAFRYVLTFKLVSSDDCCSSHCHLTYFRSKMRSPDGTLLCCGTIETHSKTETKGKLCFLETQSQSQSQSQSRGAGGGGSAASQDKPVMQISVTKGGVGAIVVRWQAVTNQIFCSTSSGSVTVLYDPRISKKGAILAAARAPRREKDPGDFVIMGEIYNPHALPMYRVSALQKD
jgi:WD repeat-containing protein 70